MVPTLTLLLWAFQHLGGFLHLRYNLEAELLELFSATPEVREVFGGLLEQTTQYLERGARPRRSNRIWLLVYLDDDVA